MTRLFFIYASNFDRVLPAQADHLINKLKTDKRIDWNNDWKIITLLIGGNNLCDYCFDRVRMGLTFKNCTLAFYNEEAEIWTTNTVAFYYSL